jgi:predicted nucleic acid-binding protein
VSRVFVDTSAILALVNPNDEHHRQARKGFESLSTRKAGLVTSSYVLLETYSLLARRMGLAAMQAFRGDFAPLLEVAWVDEKVHDAALDLLVERRKRGLSLVDTTSFVVMRNARLDEVFCIDPDFEDEGFLIVS